jgi:hypothetical protein
MEAGSGGGSGRVPVSESPGAFPERPLARVAAGDTPRYTCFSLALGKHSTKSSCAPAYICAESFLKGTGSSAYAASVSTRSRASFHEVSSCRHSDPPGLGLRPKAEPPSLGRAVR